MSESESTSTYGHNKYQIIIEDLNNTIHNLQKDIDDKSKEIDIFKENFISLQHSLKDSNDKITSLTTQLNNKNDEHNALIKKNNQDNLTNLTKIHEINKKYQDTLNTLNQIQSENNTLSNNNNVSIEKYNDLKHKYKDLLDNFESNNSQLQNLKNDYDNIKREYNLSLELNNNLSNEINFLKIELSSFESSKTSLQQLIYQKDDELRDLYTRINQSPPIKDSIKNPSLNTPISNRSLKISKRN